MATTDAAPATNGASSPEQAPAAAVQVPNSPSSAFAALSLDDAAPSSSSTQFTPAHRAEIDAATKLVAALDAARKQSKPLIRSTGHRVDITAGSTSNTGADHHHLLSWKVAEFAYRKATGVGSELPTLARGLFTERVDTGSDTAEKHRIVVRGYDKFFNLGEMPWTKPPSIERFTTAPYVLTFKENGCIIFVAALSPSQIVVTSKHSLGGLAGAEVTHAQKGREWLLKHLASVGRTESQLAAELWRRNETAAFELCDDDFEEHVLAYDRARSGLHLHGLNANAVRFATRPMPDVDAFAEAWGFIRTRWIELPSLQEVQRVTAEIEQTGAWEGEPIEGFVIRTHMPTTHQLETIKADPENKAVSPPYAPGQAWFYKVKFDEPYLMYRDWRELSRKMLKEKEEWQAKVAATQQPASDSTPAAEPDKLKDPETKAEEPAEQASKKEGEGPSKAALKREKKRLAKQDAKEAATARAAAQAAGILPPSPPQPRARRPETLAFIEWCYDRLYGNASKSIAAQPSLFAGLTQNKGIIAMRNAFLAHLASAAPVPAVAPVEKQPDTRAFSKTVLAPVAVPGCGKTVLAVALHELYGVSHVQSDEFKAKKGFLGAVERDIRAHAGEQHVVFADKNNHLQQHRDDMIELAHQLSTPPAVPQAKKGKVKVDVGRVRTVALVWDLDSVPLNTLHRLCAARIEARGDNHQTLVADTAEGAVAGMRSHEQILWRFLEALEPFHSAHGKGEGSQGYGDASFDHVVQLSVRASAKDNLMAIIKAMAPVLGWSVPSDARVEAALAKAVDWKVTKKSRADKKDEAGVRYFGLAVELDVRATLDSLFAGRQDEAAQFYASVRGAGRVNARPHVTLVHGTNRAAEGEDKNASDAKWDFYTRLLSNASRTSTASTGGGGTFEVELSTVLYERDTLLTFPIDRITPPRELADEFAALHVDWHPHITIATRDAEVRPYLSHSVVQHWREGGSEAVVLKLGGPVVAEARVFGMS